MNIVIRSIAYMELVPCSTGFLFQDLNTEQCYAFKYGHAPLSVVVFFGKITSYFISDKHLPVAWEL